jgi:hypothetical protein
MPHANAFTRGLQLAAGISAVGSIVLAIFVAIALRRVRGSAETESGPGPQLEGDDWEPDRPDEAVLERS